MDMIIKAITDNDIHLFCHLFLAKYVSKTNPPIIARVIMMTEKMLIVAKTVCIISENGLMNNSLPISCPLS